MQTILEHGIFISFTHVDKYEKAKTIIDTVSKQIEEMFPGKSGMHAITLANKKLLLSCCLCNGIARFGVFHTEEKELYRECNADIVLGIGEKNWEDLINRIENSVRKELILTPLNELWELSIQKEHGFADSNGLVELKDAAALNVSIEELQEQGNIEKD